MEEQHVNPQFVADQGQLALAATSNRSHRLQLPTDPPAPAPSQTHCALRYRLFTRFRPKLPLFVATVTRVSGSKQTVKIMATANPRNAGDLEAVQMRVHSPMGAAITQISGGDAEWDSAAREVVWRVPSLAPGQKVLRSASVSLTSAPDTALPKSKAVVSYESRGFLYSGANVAGEVGTAGTHSSGADAQSLTRVVGHITFMPQ